MANPFVHIELLTDDLAASKQFYGSLFDWKLEDVPMGEGGYTMIRVGEGTGGGMMNNPVPGSPSHWLAYVDVKDLDAAVAKAQSLGATVLRPKTEIPPGWFSVIADPTGAALALWQSKGNQ